VPDQPCVVVVGTGMATGVPDQCVIHLGLNAIADTAALALDQCAEAADRAIAALLQKGVDHSEIRTTNLSVQDFFDQSKQEVTARIASYRLQVTVTNLDDVGGVVADLSSAVGDALQIHSLHLVISDPVPLEQEARRLAVLSAQSKATELAETANVRLGQILSIQDEGASTGTPYPARPLRLSAVNEAASVPVDPGEVTASSSVTITYALDG
jgi:uncharacterized protein